MRRALPRLVIFVIGLLVLDRLTAAGLSELYRYVHREDHLHRRPEVLYFGDSRFHFAVDPAVIRARTGLSGYNLAHEGGGMVYSRGLQAVALATYRPRLLVLQVMDLDGEKASAAGLAPYLGYPQVRELFRNYSWQVRVRYLVLHTPRYNDLLPSLVKRALLGSADEGDGYVPLHGTRPSRVWPPEPRHPEADFARACLEDFLTEARRADVPVLIVETPSRAEPHSPSYEVFRQAALRHGVPLADYSSSGADRLRLESHEYYDDRHLNVLSAPRFSASLAERIAALLPEAGRS
ncbi:MAG: hypothetical protein MOGMAGMI_01636 [Candidatus Omnitrophica bacterium]|nr:hypothetical protein [Candidatus Omnitrophota bacterium]